MQVEKEFALSFNGIESKVGNMQFQVFEDTIVVSTEIHARREKWFKDMQLDMACYHEFLKLEFRNTKLRATMPR